MDRTLAALVDFVDSVDPALLPSATVAETVRRVVDTVGCGAGGFASAPAEMARAVVRGASGPIAASVYGERDPVLVDFAGFANATANRYLDFNDFGSSGHPSDMIPAMLAVAEGVGANGRATIAAVHVAYEIATVLAESVPTTTGWDQGIYSSLAVAGGVAKLLGLDRERMANAFSLAIVPSLPLRVTRFGELAEWKAAAVPHAAMTATFAARLAREGMTGPPAPFEGRYGLFEQAWEPFELRLPGGAPSAVERSSLKRFGACYWGQAAIDIASRLREGLDVASVAHVAVATTDAAYRAIGGGVGDRAEKWRPTTRETADHSMAFLVASALLDGTVDDETYRDLGRSDRLALMQRIEVVENGDLTARSTRDRCPTRVEIVLADGSSRALEQDVARGHPANPMTDAEIATKFDGFVSEVLPDADAAELSELAWSLADLDRLDGIGRLFRRFGSGRPT